MCCLAGFTSEDSRGRHLKVVSAIRIAVCVALLAVIGQAGELAVPERPRYAFQHYGEQFGIGSATVNTIAQDRNGFIWFGTQTGVIRFDGVNVKFYGTKEGLPGDWIDQLLVAPDGALWVADRNKGIARFDGSRWNQIHLRISCPPLISAYILKSERHEHAGRVSGCMTTGLSKKETIE